MVYNIPESYQQQIRLCLVPSTQKPERNTDDERMYTMIVVPHYGSYRADHASALPVGSAAAKEGDYNGANGHYQDQDGGAVVDVDRSVRLCLNEMR